MSWLRPVVRIAAAAAFAFTAAASAQKFSPIDPPQPVQNDGKIEVLEFFWYGCPHCYALEPNVVAWAKKAPKDVVFKRIPAIPSDAWLEPAKMFYSLEAMGKLEEFHPKVFDAFHKDNVNLNNKKIREEWLAKNGINLADYEKAEKSFSVATNLNRAKALTYSYKVDSVPRIAVNGKYYTSAEKAGDLNQVFVIVDQLIGMSRKGKANWKVFLTGASSGIGEALARHYAARGATLGLVARRGDLLKSLQAAIGGESEGYACDVRDLAAMKAAAEAFIAKHGVPDVVIANAGVSHGTLTEDADDVAVFHQIMDVNVNGVVNTFHPFIAPMKARGAGTLAGIASVAGFRGIPGASAYSSSKAAVISYCEALRVEMRRSGVRVTTVCPGYIATPMTAQNPYPMPFIISADDFARRCAAAIDRQASLAVIPWPMAILGRIYRLLPNALFDRMMARAGRKPRKAPD